MPTCLLQHYILARCSTLSVILTSNLFEKMAKLDMPDEIYNWIVSCLAGHSHCTSYREGISAIAIAEITASVILGPGPASYIVIAADMKAVTSGNQLLQFAVICTSSFLPSKPTVDRQNSRTSKNGHELTISNPIRPNMLKLFFLTNGGRLKFNLHRPCRKLLVSRFSKYLA